MTTPWWVPLLAAFGSAVLVLMGSWAVADLLTVRSRLRRRLDKELAIRDRLPDGYGKERLTVSIQRAALELVYRDEKEPNRERQSDLLTVIWGLTLLVCGLVLLGIELTGNWVHQGDPAADYLPYYAPVFGLVVISVGQGVRRGHSATRVKFIDEHMSDDAQPKGTTAQHRPMRVRVGKPHMRFGG